MILKAIEMQGFKYFPEKTVLNFNRGITAVVGPNGSGKSNISDAVRWVLGEQSTKSLRSSKMEDVIFDGTKVRKAHTFAQVTLRLDNTDRTINEVDEDEITVTRRFFRSGESEYKVNGKTVRLRDLHALFMDTGLGRDGYSLVSQGKIADLISGKGRECRDMLEEACGISSYRYRRQDSLKRLAQAEENLLRLRDILTELEERIGPLKTQSEKAEQFLVLSDERKTLEIGLWLYTIEKLKDELRAQEDAIAIAAGQYDSSERALQETEMQTEAAIARAQQITVTIDDIRTAIAKLEEEASQLVAQGAVLENSIQHNKETIERIGRDRAQSDESREQLQKEIAEVLQREFKDPRVGFVTVSGVDLSNDLMYSKVYVTFLNMEKDKIGEAVKVLNGAVGFFRSMVGKKMKLRVVPNITFVYDDTLVKGMELSELITKSVRHDHELQEQNQEKQQPDVDEQ